MSSKAIRVALLSVLERKGEPMSTREVATLFEMDWRTVYNHLTALEEQGLVLHEDGDGAHLWMVGTEDILPTKSQNGWRKCRKS